MWRPVWCFMFVVNNPMYGNLCPCKAARVLLLLVVLEEVELHRTFQIGLDENPSINQSDCMLFRNL